MLRDAVKIIFYLRMDIAFPVPSVLLHYTILFFSNQTNSVTDEAKPVTEPTPAPVTSPTPPLDPHHPHHNLIHGKRMCNNATWSLFYVIFLYFKVFVNKYQR